MYCTNCGKTVEDGAAFCTNCGRRMDTPPIVTEAEQQAAEIAEATGTEPSLPVNEAENPQPASGAAYENSTLTAPYAPEINGGDEKAYFGKGALIFCLVVIGLLAISTGVFAGLYLSVV